jgi:hypothetical protein
MPANVNRNRNRNLRSNPYAFDDLAVQAHRSAAGVAWRWRTELLALAVGITAVVKLTAVLTLTWAAVVLAAGLAVLLAIPPTRRFITRRFWCVLARHRIQRLCYEARLHTRAGRLPLVIWTRPTKVGERAWVICRAGICAEDFEAHIGELRAACYARDARVTRNTTFSQLTRIDIIRRDTLAPKETIPSPLVAVRVKPATTATRPQAGMAATRQQ